MCNTDGFSEAPRADCMYFCSRQHCTTALALHHCIAVLPGMTHDAQVDSAPKASKAPCRVQRRCECRGSSGVGSGGRGESPAVSGGDPAVSGRPSGPTRRANGLGESPCHGSSELRTSGAHASAEKVRGNTIMDCSRQTVR